MAIEITLPPLGESIREATLVKWYKQVGDQVKRGDELADVETDKATMSLECPANGVLLAVLVEEGETVVTRELLAIVGEPGEEWKGPKKPELDRKPKPATVIEVPYRTLRPEREVTQKRVSPSARRLAHELGIDINQVQPSQPGARIVTKDIEKYTEALREEGAAATDIPSHRVKLSNIRKVVAERMIDSAQDIPQFSVTAEVDASQILARLEEINQQLEESGFKVSLTALLTHLVARALVQHPMMNARFDGDGIVVYDTFNIAIAVATSDGLTAPVIHNVENKSIIEIARRLTEVSAAAREGKLTPMDISDGTFTISNLGMSGVSQFVPLVNPPQSAILGVGAALPTIVPSIDGKINKIHLMSLTVSADHRVTDGVDVAQFLATLREEFKKCEVEV